MAIADRFLDLPFDDASLSSLLNLCDSWNSFTMLILITSGVPPIRQTLRILFERAGHRVLMAETVEAGMQCLSRHARIDIVVCEWKFSRGTALDYHRRSQDIEHLTDDGARAGTPHWIILATPTVGGMMSDNRSLVDEIVAFGFKDVFEKPIDRQALLRRTAEIALERNQGQPKSDAPPQSVIADTPRTFRQEPAHEQQPPSEGMLKMLARLSGELQDLRQATDSHSRRIGSLLTSIQELNQELSASMKSPDQFPTANTAETQSN